jgi:ribosomal protein S18 acetylase RimI-like enzyme
MPRTTDQTTIRALLETDRPWAAYALGDLAPGFWEHADWFCATGGAQAVALVYRGFTPPVLFTLGPAEAVRGLLIELATEKTFALSVRPEILPLLQTESTVHHKRAMWRMVLDPSRYRPLPTDGTVPLGPADLDAIRQLFADGASAGEAPDAFHPDMLSAGVFYGVREGDALVTTAGTHLVVPSEGVAAVGNVYTHRDRRGRGLAARVTSAVTTELRRRGLATVVLNVAQHNPAAIRVYERLGYVSYCAFYEGLATRRQG